MASARVLLVLWMAMIAAGCGPKRHYDGPERAPSEIARLDVEQRFGRLEVHGIDFVRTSGQSWLLLPGSHVADVSVRFRYEHGGGRATLDYSLRVVCRARFTLEAGRSYRIYADVPLRARDDPRGYGEKDQTVPAQIWVVEAEEATVNRATFSCKA